MQESKIFCPDCGVEMNRHAEKVITRGARWRAGLIGAWRRIEEAHACPARKRENLCAEKTAKVE